MCGWRLPLLCLMCCSSNAVRAEVSIRVDGTRTRQTVEGFGATTMSLVLINAKSFSLTGRTAGEQSTAHSFWKALPPVEIGQKGVVSLEVPGLSVTSLAVPGSIKP